MPTQTFSDQLLIFVNLYPYAKNQVTPSDHSLDTVIFKVPSHGWLHPILTMPAPTIFMKLYQHAKNKLIPLVNSILESNDQIGHINIIKTETVSSICSGEIVHLEILQSDWLRRFRPISQKQNSFQRICAGIQQIKMFNTE